MTILFAWPALAIIVGIVASRRGRFGLGWFLLSLLIPPLITGPLVFVLPRRAGDQQPFSAVIKGFGVAVLIGGLVIVAMFVVSLIAIVQHGGA